MTTLEKDLPYTILEKVPGKPQMLKLAPVHEPEKEHVPGVQFPLMNSVPSYPLG